MKIPNSKFQAPGKEQGPRSRKPSRPLLRYFGGKWQLAPWIIGHFRAHSVYTDSYGGGGSVLIAKPRSEVEVYNDRDEELVNLFQVARDRGEELLEALRWTPYARSEFERSYLSAEDPLEQARRTVVRSYMGHGSTMTRLTVTGRLMRTGFRTYSKTNRRTAPVHDWKSYPEALPTIIERLRGVIIENQPALRTIETHDGPRTLHYVDPTYLHHTRGRSDGYRFEMTEEDHYELSQVLKRVQGFVVLSGYPSAEYEAWYRGWRTEEREAHADGALDRVEKLWMNFDPPVNGERLLL